MAETTYSVWLSVSGSSNTIPWGKPANVSTMGNSLIFEVDLAQDYLGYGLEQLSSAKYTLAQALAMDSRDQDEDHFNFWFENMSTGCCNVSGQVKLYFSFWNAQYQVSSSNYYINVNIGDPVLNKIFSSGSLGSQWVNHVFQIPSSFKIYAEYSSTDGSYTQNNEITSYSSSLTPNSYKFSSSDKGTKTVTFSFSGKSCTSGVNVVGLDSLSIENARQSFYIGETFAYGDSFAIYANYGDGSKENVTTLATIRNGYDKTTLSTIGSFSYSVSYTASSTNETATKTISFSVVANPITALSISGQKTSFNYGDSFEVGSLVVTATYQDGSSAVLDAGEYEISTEIGTVLSQKSSRSIQVSAGGKAASYTIVITYLDSISVTSGSYPASFYAGKYFSSEGIEVKATFKKSDGSSGSTVTLSAGDYSIDYNSAIKLSTAGTFTVTVTYSVGGLSAETSYTIDVLAVEVTAIHLNTSALSNTIAGELLYYQGYTQVRVSSKMLVTADYNNGDTGVSVSLSDCSVSPSIGSVLTSAGDNTITISYGGKSASYIVSCVEHVIDHLTVDYSNATTQFYVGDKFDYNGIVVKAVYNSGYESIISDGASGYSISPLKNYEFVESDKKDSFAITITYSGKTVTYNIRVNYPSLISLSIDASSVNLTPVNGSVWNVSLLKAIGIYSNGFEKSMTFQTGTSPENGFFCVDTTKLNLSASNEIGVTTFTQLSLPIVGKDAFSNTFIYTYLSVSVLPNKQLLSIYIKTDSAKTDYKTGETFTGEGFVIMASFLDTDGYTAIAVDKSNASITTSNPTLGSVIYKAGKYEVTFSYSYLNVTKTATAFITVIPSYETTTRKHLDLKVVRVTSLTHEEVTSFQKNDDGYIWALYLANDSYVETDVTSPKYGQRVLKQNVSNPVCYGYIIQGHQTTDTGITTEVAKTVLFDNYPPLIEGQSNITVTIPHYVKGYADRINHCTFGTLFGCNNSRNRLFVSGNPDDGFQSMDWHSEPLNVSQLDENEAKDAYQLLTYFPDTDYCQYGHSDNKVCGYSVISTGELLVIKTPSKQEPTFYVRTAGTMNAITSAGSTVTGSDGSSLTMESYTLTTGNIDAGGLTPYTVASFNGESLFLTSDGLKAVSLGTSGDLSSLTSKPRSTFVDKRIKPIVDDSSYIFCYKGYLVIISGSTAFVCHEKYISDTEYEWWVLDNMPIRVTFDMEGELWFGTDDGRLCRIVSDDGSKKYQDKPRTFVGLGGILPLSADPSLDRITINSAYSSYISNGAYVSMLNGDGENSIYANLGFFAKQESIDNAGLSSKDYQGLIISSDGVFQIKATGDDFINEKGLAIPYQIFVESLFYNGRKVYLDQISSTSSTSNNVAGYEYDVVKTDDMGEGQFKLRKSDGSFADLSSLQSMRISFKVGDNAIVKDLSTSNGSCTFKLQGDHGQVLDIIQYNNQSMSNFCAVITTPVNVGCKFVTKPYNFGSNVYKKNILSWTTVNDTDIRSQMDVAYSVDNYSKLLREAIGGQSGSRQLDLGDFSFERASVLSDVLPHVHTRWNNERNVDDIMFVFKNDDFTNCVLTNLSLLYTGGNARKGDN